MDHSEYANYTRWEERFVALPADVYTQVVKYDPDRVMLLIMSRYDSTTQAAHRLILNQSTIDPASLIALPTGAGLEFIFNNYPGSFPLYGAFVCNEYWAVPNTSGKTGNVYVLEGIMDKSPCQNHTSESPYPIFAAPLPQIPDIRTDSLLDKIRSINEELRNGLIQP